MLIPRIFKLICLIPVTAYAQPPEALPAAPPEFSTVDANRDGNINAADFQAFQDAYPNAKQYADAVANSRPGQARTLAATVNGSTVTLTWTPGGNPTITGTITQYVTRNGSLVGSVAGNVQTYIDSNVPTGDHTWRIETRNVTTGGYGGTFAPASGTPPAVTATVVTGTQPSVGWTDLSLPTGAIAVYVSSSTGSDTAAGTQSAPMRSVNAGYARLRDGFPDQLLLKCGDTWTEAGQFQITKGAGSGYQVIGSYGTGPRPKITFTGPATGFYGENRGKRGVAFVGLELAGSNQQYTNAVTMMGWNDVLVEDCYFHHLATGVVIQDLPDRPQRFKLRRNIMAEIRFPSSSDTARAQGIYIGGADQWLMEGNVFYRVGVPGSTQSRPVYIHESCTRGTFRDNTFIEAVAEAYQVRPGGTVHNNLSIRCPIGAFVGNDSPGRSDVRYNVVIESGDISAVHRRGIGIHVAGAADIRDNFVGYNTGTGWGTVFAFTLSAGSTFTGNTVWDWSRTPGDGAPGESREGSGIYMGSGTGTLTASGNRITQVRPGLIGWFGSQVITGTGNQYYQAPGSLAVWWGSPTPTGWSNVSLPPDPQCKVPEVTGMSYAAYVAECLKQSKQNWRVEYTSDWFNDKVRQRAGVGANP